MDIQSWSDLRVPAACIAVALVIAAIAGRGVRSKRVTAAALHGFRYLKTLGMETFAEFEDPPWLIIPIDSRTENAIAAVSVETPQAVLHGAEFEYEAGEGVWRRQTVVAAKLKQTLPGPQKEALVGFVDGFNPANGMHVIRRNNCIYAFFDHVSSQRSCEMTTSEKMQCMNGMIRILHGQFSLGAAAMEEISGTSTIRSIGRGIFWIFVAGFALAVPAAFLAYDQSKWMPYLGLAGVVGLSMIAAGHVIGRLGNSTAARVSEYVNRRG